MLAREWRQPPQRTGQLPFPNKKPTRPFATWQLFGEKREEALRVEEEDDNVVSGEAARCTFPFLTTHIKMIARVVSGNALRSFVMQRSKVGAYAHCCGMERNCQDVIPVRRFSSYAPDPKQIKADHDHCVELVQKRDREGYLCGLLMPAHARRSYFAVRAFNVEIASIKDGNEQIRRRRAGEGSSIALRMRMQWWRDALGQLYPIGDCDATTETPATNVFAPACWHNPVVRALHVAVEESDLTRRFLERLLDARDADLEIQQMATLEDAKMYAEDTWASLLYLSLECTGIREDAADAVASHAGLGIGLVMALRSTIHRAVNGEMAIPADLFPRPIPPTYMLGRLDPEFQMDPEQERIMRDAAQHMAYEASLELTKARELQNDIPKRGRACLLPAVPAMNYLSRIKEAEFNLWDPKLNAEQSRLWLLTILGKSWLTGTI